MVGKSAYTQEGIGSISESNIYSHNVITLFLYLRYIFKNVIETNKVKNECYFNETRPYKLQYTNFQ